MPIPDVCPLVRMSTGILQYNICSVMLIMIVMMMMMMNDDNDNYSDDAILPSINS